MKTKEQKIKALFAKFKEIYREFEEIINEIEIDENKSSNKAHLDDFWEDVKEILNDYKKD